MATSKKDRRQVIKYRIRKKISGSAAKPRLSVYRSNKEIYAQLMDDDAGVTMLSVSSREKAIASKKGTKIETAALVGKRVAEIAAEKGITTVVFDRNGYLYHGRVKSLADGAREGGLKF